MSRQCFFLNQIDLKNGKKQILVHKTREKVCDQNLFLVLDESQRYMALLMGRRIISLSKIKIF